MYSLISILLYPIKIFRCISMHQPSLHAYFFNKSNSYSVEIIVVMMIANTDQGPDTVLIHV